MTDRIMGPPSSCGLQTTHVWFFLNTGCIHGNRGQFLNPSLYIFGDFRHMGGGGHHIHFHPFPYPPSVFMKLGLKCQNLQNMLVNEHLPAIESIAEKYTTVSNFQRRCGHMIRSEYMHCCVAAQKRFMHFKGPGSFTNFLNICIYGLSIDITHTSLPGHFTVPLEHDYLIPFLLHM